MWSSALLILGTLWRVKNDDLPDVEGLEDAVNKDSLTDRKRRLHGCAGNLVGLDEPGLDRDREADRDEDGRAQLDEGADAAAGENGHERRREANLWRAAGRQLESGWGDRKVAVVGDRLAGALAPEACGSSAASSVTIDIAPTATQAIGTEAMRRPDSRRSRRTA